MDSEGLCRVIQTCAKNKVLDLKLGETIEISFTASQQDLAAREHARVVPTLGTMAEVAVLEKRAQEDLEELVKTEYEQNLLASNPLEYEKYMLSQDNDVDIPRDELEGNL